MHNPNHTLAGLHKKCSFLHWKAATCVLGLRARGIACVGLSVMMDGFNLKSLQKQLLLRKCDFFLQSAWGTREEVQIQWSFMGSSSVVSCGGILCSSNGTLQRHSRTQGRKQEHRTDSDTFTNLLADLIFIYEFLFPRTHSIFISYIYLF